MPSQETPLHRAVIEKNIPLLKAHSNDRKALQQLNSWGLNPVQLAQLLGYTDCADTLQPPVRKRVKAMLKGEQELRRLDAKQFKEVFGVEYLSHQRFPNYEFLKKVLVNCPILMRTDFWGGENRAWGEACQMELAAGYVENVAIKWIDEEIGYGIFASEDFGPGEYIGEYTGFIRQSSILKPDYNEYCYHYPTRFFSFNYILVDALHGGNETRFINHSDDPNLEPKCLMQGRLLHIVFFTQKFIPAGTQMTYDYGKDFWKHKPNRKKLL